MALWLGSSETSEVGAGQPVVAPRGGPTWLVRRATALSSALTRASRDRTAALRTCCSLPLPLHRAASPGRPMPAAGGCDPPRPTYLAAPSSTRPASCSAAAPEAHDHAKSCQPSGPLVPPLRSSEHGEARDKAISPLVLLLRALEPAAALLLRFFLSFPHLLPRPPLSRRPAMLVKVSLAAAVAASLLGSAAAAPLVAVRPLLSLPGHSIALVLTLRDIVSKTGQAARRAQRRCLPLLQHHLLEQLHRGPAAHPHHGDRRDHRRFERIRNGFYQL